MNDAEMPENAAGTTTRSVACMRVAPSANAPSRNPFGTACSASSDSDDTSGRIMIPITMPGPSALNPDSDGMNRCSSGVTKQQREVAVDDRRNAREHFEQRLHDAAQPSRRVFAEVDRRQQAGGQRDRHRDGGDERGAGDERKHAEVFLGEERRPFGAGEELDDGHFAQERERLEEQHADDAGGDRAPTPQHRRTGAARCRTRRCDAAGCSFRLAAQPLLEADLRIRRSRRDRTSCRSSLPRAAAARASARVRSAERIPLRRRAVPPTSRSTRRTSALRAG